ncbi:MAG TPA: 30S ribosomal protein S9 [Longimicrobiales bacterium]|nr:30S ribosomal protein S9 [Longimicrobiales bacterium]
MATTVEQHSGVGRRKTSVARVYIRPGNGTWVINGRPLEEYFPRNTHQLHASEPLVATENDGAYDVKVVVRGGGKTGQAGAVRLGLARALLRVDEEYRAALRPKGMLTRDPRKVERKKPGQPGARKRFQFSKR